MTTLTGSPAEIEPTKIEHCAPSIRPEQLHQRLLRWTLGTAWALRSPRRRKLPAVLVAVAKYYAGLGPAAGDIEHPAPSAEPWDGFGGVCPDMSVQTIIQGYSRGFYPHAHIGPLKWWMPSRRCVLFFENLHMEKNLRRRLRNNHFGVTFDRDFVGVLNGCAEPRSGRPPLTWIRPDVMHAFVALHEAGYAHSVEVWDKDGSLAGGLFGVALGGYFSTESQFFRKRDASKVGFATLNCHLSEWGFLLNDGKKHTPYLEQTGFETISRSAFQKLIANAIEMTERVGKWAVDPSLDIGNWHYVDKSIER